MKNSRTKWFIAVLLSFCITLAAFPITSFAANGTVAYINDVGYDSLQSAVEAATDPIQHEHPVCGETGCIHDGHSGVVYMPLDDGSGKLASGIYTTNYSGEYVLKEGNYYLTNDLTLDNTLIVNGSVSFCLNGHKLTFEFDTDQFYDVYVKTIGINFTGGTLNICDCKTGGSIEIPTQEYEGEVYLGIIEKRHTEPTAVHQGGGAVNLYSGILDSGAAGIECNGGTALNIYGGVVTGSGDVISSYAPVTISGGTVSGIMRFNNAFTMTGGTVGSVYMQGKGKTCTISGGTVDYLSDAADNIVYTISGTAEVNRIYISWSSKIHVFGGTLRDRAYITDADARLYISGSPVIGGSLIIPAANTAADAVIIMHAEDNSAAYTGGALSIRASSAGDGKYVVQGVADKATADKCSYYNSEKYTLEYDSDAEAIKMKELPTYTVTLQNGDGYTLTGGSAPVVSGGSYTFTFGLTDKGYQTNSFAVKVNGQSIFLGKDGSYTINNITSNQVVTVEGVMVDETAPTVEIKIDENKWASFINSITFGLFFKDTQVVTIDVGDAESGVAATAYFISNIAYDTQEGLESAVGDNWTVYTDSFSIKPNSKNIIYVKAMDNVGNVTYVSSQGIVIYTDAQQNTDKIQFTRLSTQDVTADVTLNGNTIDKINDGVRDLKAGTDYTVDGGTITFKANYLNTLAAGNYTITISYNPMGENYKETAENDAPAATSLTLQVNKAVGSVTITSDISKIYNGTAVTVPVYDTDSTGSVTIEWYKDSVSEGNRLSKMPKNAGNYIVRVIVEADDNYLQSSDTAEFTISKASYDMSGSKWNYETSFNYDGKEKIVLVSGLPEGVTVKAYSGNTETVAGNYTASVVFTYDSDNYNEPTIENLSWSIVNHWTAAEYSVSQSNDNGWLNNDFVITAENGYLIATDNKDNSNWTDKLIYTEETADGEVTFYLRKTDTGEISLAKTVNYRLDKTAPTGKVYFDERNGWEKFLNIISFGLFFKDEVTVKAEAADDFSGIAAIEYYATADILDLDGVKAVDSWTVMPKDGVGETLQNGKRFVYYIRLTDNAGNVSYLSTDGAEYDTAAPVIDGVKNGDTYYTSQKITVTDKNLAVVTLNGEYVTLDESGSFILPGNIGAEYEIAATDKVGNSTTVSVTMKEIASISQPIDNLDRYNVKSGDKTTIEAVRASSRAVEQSNAADTEKAALQEILNKCDELLQRIADVAGEIKAVIDGVNGYDAKTVQSSNKAVIEEFIERIDVQIGGDNLTQAEIEALNTVKETAEALLEKISDTAAEIADITDKVNGYKPETVTSEDKQDIEDLINRIDTLLNSDTLTENEKSDLTVIKGIAEALLEKISDTAAEIAEITDKVNVYKPETVTFDDKSELENLINRIDALLNGENLTDDEKTALENVKNIGKDLIEKINKTAAEIADITDKVNSYKPETVTSEDKSELEDLINRIDALLNGENLTDDEKTALENVKNIGKDLIEKINKTAAEIADITDKVNSYKAETVTSENKQDIEDLINRIDTLLNSDTLTENEKSDLTGNKENAESLLDKIGEAAKAVDTEEVKDITSENVTPEDKADLEKAKEDLEKALEDYANNLTQDEKKSVQDNIDRIVEALVVIEKVKAVEAPINALPDIVTKDDAELVKVAEDAYNALTHYEKSLVNKDCKAKLDKAVADLAELNKPTDTTSPNTGDSSNLWLWLAIMFISGGAITTFVVYDRRKRTVQK